MVRKARINPSVLLAHSKTLSITPAKYPMTRSEIKALTVPQGVQAKTFDNIYLGPLPKRWGVCLVSNKAFNGDFGLNPFNFKTFGLNFMSLYVDGAQIPSKPLQPNFEKSLSVRMYHSLFRGKVIHFLDQGNDISREEYKERYCISVFDFTPDLGASSRALEPDQERQFEVRSGFRDGLARDRERVGLRQIRFGHRQEQKRHSRFPKLTRLSASPEDVRLCPTPTNDGLCRVRGRARLRFGRRWFRRQGVGHSRMSRFVRADLLVQTP